MKIKYLGIAIFFLCLCSLAFLGCRQNVNERVRSIGILSLKVKKGYAYKASDGWTIKVPDDVESFTREDIKEIEFAFEGESEEEDHVDFTFKSVESLEVWKAKQTSFKIRGKKGRYEDTEIKVNVIREGTEKALISLIVVLGGSVKGVNTGTNKLQELKLLNGGKDILVEFKGPVFYIALGSQKKEWTSCKVNDEQAEIRDGRLGYGVRSMSFIRHLAPTIGEEIPIVIEIEEKSGKDCKVEFKVKRVAGTVDIENLGFKINDDDGKKLMGNDFLEKLANSTPEFSVARTAILTISCIQQPMNAERSIKNIKVNGTDGIFAKLEDSYANSATHYVQFKEDGIVEAGSNVRVEIEPEDTENYHTVIWNFKLKYREPQPIPMYYVINGKEGNALPKYFTEGIEKNEKPHINLEENYANLLISTAEQIEKNRS